MMLDTDTRIAVVGLGVLGGSYVQALHSAGFYHVIGIDIDASTIEKAKERHWIEEGGNDPSLVKDADLVIFALYPHTLIHWLEENGHWIHCGALVSDVTGVKRQIIAQVNALLPDGVEFIACHPMAGRESRGIDYADASRFEGANFIIVPTAENTRAAIDTAHSLAEALGFTRISVLSPEDHDRMVGFLSQLTHVIAMSLMNASDNTHLAQYTGDSFRDLTRIANINEDLWPELFIMNKDNLLREIDEFDAEMKRFRSLLENEDYEGMKEKMRTATERRRLFDKPKKEVKAADMKRIMFINGANLNLLGIREKNLYGSESYEDLIHLIETEAKKRQVAADCRQSNHEGDLVDWIQEAYFKHYDGVVINPGAYTHTSLALGDAVHGVAPLPVVEVHITDIAGREEYRHVSYEAPYCLAQIKGHGFAGYIEAMDLILKQPEKAGE